MHHNSTLPWSIYIDWRGVSATVWTVAVPLHKSLAGGFLYLFVRESICWSLLTTIIPNFPIFLRESICWPLLTTVSPDFPYFVREGICWPLLTTVFPNFPFFVRESICWSLLTTVFPNFPFFSGKYLLISPHNNFSKFSIFVRDSISWSLLIPVFPKFPFFCPGKYFADFSSQQCFQIFHFLSGKAFINHSSQQFFQIFHCFLSRESICWFLITTVFPKFAHVFQMRSPNFVT